jgi:hypothetical protein
MESVRTSQRRTGIFPTSYGVSSTGHCYCQADKIDIENWEKLLPLTPTEAGIVKNSPNNMTFQMKGIDWSGKQISFNQGYINRVIPASDQDEDEEATQAPPSPTSVLSTASL